MSRAKMFMAAIVGVLALSGLTSSMASAVTAGWMVNGTMLKGTAALNTLATVDSIGILKAAGVVEVVCKGTSLHGVNPVLNAVTQMGDASSLSFLECAAGKNGEVCPLGPNQGTTIGTLPVLVDLTLDGPLAVKGRFLPISKLFATIEFGGSECSFAGVNNVTGSQPFLAPTGQDERTVQLITATNEEVGALKLASSSATLEGSILVSLASGLPFSFL